MELTRDNYFSNVANKSFLSVSTVKSIEKCEAEAFASLHKGYIKPGKNVFLQGQYLHAWLEGKLEEFKIHHPEMYSSRGKTAGQLKSE